MIEVTIDGKKIKVEKETKILEAAKMLGIHIPTLCYHEGLPPDGNCRLCQVEVVKNNKSKLAVACMFPIREPMEIFTDNEKVMTARRSIIKLHLNRCPQAKILQDLAEEYGVKPLDERFVAENPDLCIRCGRCVRACEALGNNCIGFSGRGWDRKIIPPFDQPPKDCLGCAACAEVCPTGAITVKEDLDSREIWGKKFRFIRCKICGEPIGTEEYILKKGLGTIEDAGLCPQCKKRDEARRIKNV